MLSSMATPSDRRPVIAVIFAFLIMVAFVGILYLFVHRKDFDLTLSKVDIFAPHTEIQAPQQSSMHVLGEASESEDDLYVVAHINITDKLHQRAFIYSWSATATFADGTTMDATLVPKSELPRLEQIFPQITSLATQPIGDGDELDPNVTDSGSIVLLFPNTTAEKWSNKRSATLTINLRDLESLTVKLP